MISDTLKRFDRLVSILIQLQSKKIVKAQEMAERFQVSHRTIYRDIKTLENAGVPVFGEAGIGYSLVDGYRLPPVMFTKEEAASFLAAEKLMQSFTDKGLGMHFESALIKIKSVLRGAEKEWISNLETVISVHNQFQYSKTIVSNAMELLMESMASQQQIFIQYLAVKDEIAKERRIEPVGIFHENQFWYILAYCHLRKDYRQFRLDRIHKIALSELRFTQKHPLTIADYKNQKQTPKTQKVRILVDRIIANYLQYDKQQYGFESQKEIGAKMEMTFYISDRDSGFARWFLMFADYAEILEPLTMKDTIKNILQKGLAQIEK